MAAVVERFNRGHAQTLEGYPSEVIQTLFHLEGRPVSYTGRRYLLTALDTDYSAILLKSARQCEKSTNLSFLMLLPTVSISRYNTLYLSPSFTQTKEFSLSRFDEVAYGSPWVTKFRYSTKCKRAITLKTWTNGSANRFRYAYYTADRTRGIRADTLAVDEIQDILPENIPIAEQTMGHSAPHESAPQWHHRFYKRRIYAGTPKTLNNTIEHYWKISTQNTWMVPCRACGEWNGPLMEKNIGKHGPICAREGCRRPITPSEGLWHVERPGAEFLGLHITRLMVPIQGQPGGWLDWQKDVVSPYENYGKVEFYNEVLGYPCESESSAITEPELIAACTSPYGFINDPRKDLEGLLKSVRLFAGIDWGEARPSRTVLTIGGWFDQNTYSPIFIKRYEAHESQNPMEILEDIRKWCTLFAVEALGVDVGHGWGLNSELMKHFGAERIMQFAYIGGQGTPRWKYHRDTHKFSINRTAVMSEMFTDLKKFRIRLPAWNMFEKYSKDFLGIFVDYSPQLRTMMYNHNPGTPDDVFHSMLYSRLCGELFGRSYVAW